MASVKRKFAADIWKRSHIKDLLCNLSVEQLNFIFSDQLYSNIFLYDANGLDIIPADYNSVPWFAAFYLGWPHRRHRTVSQQLPSPSAVSNACANLANRIHWQWIFRQSPASSYVLRLKRRFDTPPCSELIPSDLRAWTYNLHKGVLSVTHNLLRSRNARRRVGHGFGYLEKCARNWILNNKVVIYGDKRGHVALLDANDFIRCHRHWLVLPRYNPMPRHSFTNSWWQAVNSTYLDLAKKVIAVDSSVTLNALLQSMRRPMKSIFARIGNTCKTHKARGRVALRYLRLASAYPFESIAKWLSQTLDKRLRSFKHFIIDSRSFMAEVSDLVLPPNAQILHFDLDDFFNCGSQNFLSIAAARILYSSHRHVATDICRFLLRHQYVYTENDDDIVWNVVLGSGQGLTASAAIANSAFLISARAGWFGPLPLYNSQAIQCIVLQAIR